MKKVKIRNCQYAVSPISGKPLYCDVYVLLGDKQEMLFHENLWLVDVARSHPLETARGYASDLLSFVRMAKPLGGWEAIGQPEMTGYLHGELFQRRQYKKSTMRRHVATLRAFYEWLEEKGYLTTVPAFEWAFEHLYAAEPNDRITYHTNQHSFHTLYIERAEFFDKLLPAVNSDIEFIRLRDRLCLRFGYECGTRAHEVLKLNTTQVRDAISKAREKNDGLWAVATVKLTGKGALNRDLLIPPRLCEFIWDYLIKYRNKINQGQGPLISTYQGQSLQDQKHASTVFRRACRTAKWPRAHHQGYHRLRKSFGTNLVQDCYDNGEDPWVLVPRRMGHKNPETTKLYIQFDALRNRRSNVLRGLHMQESKYQAIQRQQLQLSDAGA